MVKSRTFPARTNDVKATTDFWLSGLGFDAAKLGLLLYVVGLLTSTIYYSRFNIPALGLAKTQYIVVGVYVLSLYAVMPLVVLLIFRALTNLWWLCACFIGTVIAIDFVLLGKIDFDLLGKRVRCVGLGYVGLGLALAILTTAVVQFCFFVEPASIWRSVAQRKLSVTFILVPPRGQLIAFGLISCLVFSIFWFPRIPAYLGGGKPLRVQVFTRDTKLPMNRFFRSGSGVQNNKCWASFSLNLLYETDKDAYFVASLRSLGILTEYSVMRIRKDEILRIDYNAPRWFRWKGAQ